MQEVAFVEFHVKVLLPPLLTLVGDADNDTTGAGVEVVTETEAVAWRVPPAPVQLSVNEVLALNAPVLALPETGFEPLHPPDAVQEVALVDVHVNVLLAPLATDVGDADNDTTGAGVGAVTDTDAVAWRVPPAPVQLSVNEVLALNAPVLALPDTGFEPVHPPDAAQEVALVDVHVNVLLAPLATDVGDADSVTVGAGVDVVTVTVVLARVVPP